MVGSGGSAGWRVTLYVGKRRRGGLLWRCGAVVVACCCGACGAKSSPPAQARQYLGAAAGVLSQFAEIVEGDSSDYDEGDGATSARGRAEELTALSERLRMYLETRGSRPAPVRHLIPAPFRIPFH